LEKFNQQSTQIKKKKKRKTFKKVKGHFGCKNFSVSNIKKKREK